ncbi:hypothetical protein H310_10964 [Aphanomyces invadans]|uniref:N-acetyltransferase domain-containing protein n=1 Tax=Aphanomyces invadans TaxID=157072 RepID=A0A024TMX0_9STRA|nr:hypothetical protein H310_10964 [Aphanomyces invadans]ETV95495.1 hypothetical protein H310_10964 [Aphanomyces invadans]|eukprot:XP_008875688.1 hypothetical protein H310_10964 [Aphanomyces invadans]
MTITIRALRKDEVKAWVAHCTELFKHDSDAYFISHLEDDCSALEDMNNILVADDDGAIASTVRVVPRRQFFGGQLVSMGGIAEVSTKEEYRGKGLATKLLQSALDGPLASFDMSALHTDADRLGGFYRKVGYIPMPLRTASFPVELPLPPLPPTIRLSPIQNLADHASALLDLYHTVAPSFNGPIQRSIPYFCRWIASRHRRSNIQSIGAWNENGELVGYAFGKSTPADSALAVVIDELIVYPASKTSHAVAVHLVAAFAPGRSFMADRVPVPVAIELGLLPSTGPPPADTVISEDCGFMIQRHNLSTDLWQYVVATDDKNVFFTSDGF